LPQQSKAKENPSMSSSAGYLALEIHATAASTAIWFSGDEWALCDERNGQAQRKLVLGRYIVELNLATTPHGIDLDDQQRQTMAM
jgi:hypothetical protein